MALSHQRTYLMHAMLGIAAAHLSEAAAQAQDVSQATQYRKTELHHWHHALRLYRAELSNELAPDHVDSLITTCMLLVIHSFYMSDPNEKSFVNATASQQQSTPRWLVMILGFRLVLRHIERYITVSAWFEVFNTAAPARDGWTSHLEKLSDIHADFLDLCDITESNKHLPNIYKDALWLLFPILQVEQLSMRDLPQLMAFMGRLSGPFVQLLTIRDSRALIIMLYWLVLLNSLGLWWVKVRAAHEAQAILGYLQMHHDERIQKMLVMPRIAFGSSSAY